MGGRLVGREAELERIAGALVSARDGASRCLLVTGEAGIGKSRLVAEAVGSLDDALVLTGHAVDMSTGEIPFGVVADTLRDLVRVEGPDVLLPAERAALAPLLPGTASPLAVDRVQLLSAFLDLLERLASTRLVVWVVEDLHWADSATRDLVRLAARTLRSGLLLLATVRTDDPERSAEAAAALTSYVAGLARTPGRELLPLSRLSTDAVQRQLRDLLGSTPSADVATRVERLSDGIPFVVEELVAAAGRPELSTVAAVASGRLGSLSPEARRLVEAAAVGDGHLRISLLEQVLDATPDELDAALAEALHAGILRTDHETDAVGFRHALLREATDRELGPGARRSWHRRWAEVLEDNPGVLAADPAALAVAEHWHQARDVRRALAATVAALPAAERVCLPGEETVLVARVMRAFEVLDDAEAVAGMTLREAWGRGLLAVTHAKRSLREEFKDSVPLDRLAPAERAAAALFAEDDHAKGEANLLPEDTVRAAIAAFEDSPVDELAVVVWAAAGSRARDVAQGTALVNRALDGARSLGSRRAVFLCAAMGSYQAQITGDPAAAVELLRGALQDHPDDAWQGAVGCIGNLVWCEAIMGRHAEARAAAEDGFARLPRPHLSVEAWEHLTENAAFSWILTGHWQRARTELEDGAPWWDDDVRSSSARLDVLDLTQRGTADVDRWWPRVDEPAPGGAPQALVRELLARAAVLDGDLSRMRSVLLPAWTDDNVLFQADQLACTAVLAARAEADAALSGPRADRAEATEHLASITRVTASFPCYGPLGEVWPVALAAELDRFHGRDARPALLAALEGWERIGHVPDVAVTHLSLAEQEAIHGDRSAAREHLVEGREIARRLEAVPMLERADALAERYALSSLERRTDDVLTDREVEVLRLVADGLTNGQIGTRLFMSPKTASVHVSHILAKLGAANRTEAATVARRQGLLQ
jgi:DNA-binding CsgD family transcriptional regulator